MDSRGADSPDFKRFRIAGREKVRETFVHNENEGVFLFLQPLGVTF